jgi:peroxisomal 3,2-trans-enoyl-CoA isomerase
MQWAATCDAVKVVVLTGRGKYYTAGVELSKPDNSPEATEKLAKKRQVTK